MKISDKFHFVKPSRSENPPLLDLFRVSKDYIHIFNDKSPTKTYPDNPNMPSSRQYAALKQGDIIFRADKVLTYVAELSTPLAVLVSHHPILRANEPVSFPAVLIKAILRFQAEYYWKGNILNREAILNTLIDATPNGAANAEIPQLNVTAESAILKAQRIIEDKRHQIELLQKFQTVIIHKMSQNKSISSIPKL